MDGQFDRAKFIGPLAELKIINWFVDGVDFLWNISEKLTAGLYINLFSPILWNEVF